MGVLGKLRLRWFLIGFFSSAEGWNWEKPFLVNNRREGFGTLRYSFKVFLEMLEENNEYTMELLRCFVRCLKEEREQIEDLSELTDKIMEKLY